MQFDLEIRGGIYVNAPCVVDGSLETLAACAREEWRAERDSKSTPLAVGCFILVDTSFETPQNLECSIRLSAAFLYGPNLLSPEGGIHTVVREGILA